MTKVALLLCVIAATAPAATAATPPVVEPLSSTAAAAPAAVDFADIFVSTANAYARAHHDAKRIGHADCVQAAPGRYMCSYRAMLPGRSECHLVQARWTPELASSFTVTLAGRVKRCATLREALRSLG